MLLLRKLIRINYIAFIIVFVIPVLAIGSADYIFNLPEGVSDNQVANEFKKYPLIIFFLITVIFVPFMETLIFQGLIIELIRLKVKKTARFGLSIILSALLFGLSHPYNLYYIIITFLSGLFLALSYYLCLYRKQSSILTVMIIHGVLNFAALIDSFYL